MVINSPLHWQMVKNVLICSEEDDEDNGQYWEDSKLTVWLQYGPHQDKFHEMMLLIFFIKSRKWVLKSSIRNDVELSFCSGSLLLLMRLCLSARSILSIVTGLPALTRSTCKVQLNLNIISILMLNSITRWEHTRFGWRLPGKGRDQSVRREVTCLSNPFIQSS